MAVSKKATLMLDNLEIIPSIVDQVIKCFHCGHFCQVQDGQCPNCGEQLQTHPPVITKQIHSVLSVKYNERPGIVQFGIKDSARLKIADTSTVISLPLERLTILGRKILPGSEELLDLSEFNAFQHGVSRRHCQLQRQDERLILTDLGSSNGTFLNNEGLLPFTNYIVAHDDHLILGTLHFTIAFESMVD